jgi:cyanobactin maturation PatA/PatG family protease
MVAPPLASQPGLPLATSVPAASAVVPQSGGAACGCKAQALNGSLVYVLGTVGYDFPTIARRDYFIQKGLINPNDPAELLAYLENNPSDASQLVWTLTQETIPIYSLRPEGSYAVETYSLIEEFLSSQLHENVERVSIPGYLAGSVVLSTGDSVPMIQPVQGGMFSWTTRSLVESVVGPVPNKEPELAAHTQRTAAISNFLTRVYYDLRNLGVTPQDRALNFGVTNAFQIGEIFKIALKQERALGRVQVLRSAICRPESECWDVTLTLFNPKKRLEEANLVFAFTVDVSNVVPVTIGQVQSWYAFE